MKRPLIASLVVALVMASLRLAAQPAVPAPRFEVDPYWPKPFPLIKDKDGKLHRWATGEIGGTCIDSHDHIFTLNRGWQQSQLGKLHVFEQQSSVPAPPVVAYDPAGNVVASWGDASLLAPGGGTKVMPESLHGCFADHDDNIWIAGNADGIVQKYSHDGKLLLQIGTKGVCDGKAAPAAPRTAAPFFPTCVSPGLNGSKTMLNDPADIAVDPNPDPVTSARGSVYVADGYGNHRIVVFDGKGQFLRQWGSPGTGAGQFALEGGGHPHCVTIGRDGLVYVCDRGNARVEVFDRTGKYLREIPIAPAGFAYTGLRTNDITFSNDPNQTYFYTSDVGSGTVWSMLTASVPATRPRRQGAARRRYTIQEGRDVVVGPGHGRGSLPSTAREERCHGARCAERTVGDAGERSRPGAGDTARGGVGRAPGADPVDRALEPARHPIPDLERIVRPSADVPLGAVSQRDRACPGGTDVPVRRRLHRLRARVAASLALSRAGDLRPAGVDQPR